MRPCQAVHRQHLPFSNCVKKSFRRQRDGAPSKTEIKVAGTQMANRKGAVAFIGCAGVPNRYGGFESFAEHIGSHLASNGVRVVVTCQKMLYRDDPAPIFNGIERLMLRSEEQTSELQPLMR